MARDCMVEHRKLELLTDASIVYCASHKPREREKENQSRLDMSTSFVRVCVCVAGDGMRVLRTKDPPCRTG